MSHPLVYRKQKFSSKEFRDQFKFAIADLVRDHYLNKEAYKKSLDKNIVVKRNASMWKDALIALYQTKSHQSSVIKEKNIDVNDMKTKDNYLQTYIDSLFTKYKNDIEINFKELRNVELTNVNMYALKPNVPYPVVVPGFPQLTIKDRFKSDLKPEK